MGGESDSTMVLGGVSNTPSEYLSSPIVSYLLIVLRRGIHGKAFAAGSQNILSYPQ
jgi:hypothetical protein